jgi:hypothetical protein
MTPTCPQRLYDLVWAIFRKYETLARGDDDDRRQVTRAMAEQARHDLGPHYGTKSGDKTRPPSKDAIAFREDDTHLYSWDWQNGTTREPMIVVGQEAGNISDQYFIEVPPVDHLGGETPTEPPPAPAPSTLPGRAEMMLEGAWLHAYYQAPDGLQRANGLWIDGHPDWEGLGAWLFDVYLGARLAGASPADARARVVAQIQASGEWRNKHPGEQP